MASNSCSPIGRRAFTLALAGSMLTPALAQTTGYPERPITLVIGYAPGGGTDVLARLFASRLTAELGQQVIVSNRAGAGTAIASEFVARAAPDGYTLFFAESTLVVAAKVQQAPRFDPLRSYSEISGVASLPYGIVASPSFAAKDLKTLVAMAKQSPTRISYASPGYGNIGHLSAEMFQHVAQVKLTHVPYQGGGKLLPDVMSGEVPITFIGITPVLPLVKSGKLNLLAVTSASRHRDFPDVPTVAELLPGFAATTNFFLVGPAGMPQTVIDKLSDAAARVLGRKDMDEAFSAQGAELRPLRPAELKRQIAAESEQWERVVKATGAKLQ